MLVASVCLLKSSFASITLYGPGTENVVKLTKLLALFSVYGLASFVPVRQLSFYSFI